jgi:hypothetical protein
MGQAYFLATDRVLLLRSRPTKEDMYSCLGPHGPFIGLAYLGVHVIELLNTSSPVYLPDRCLTLAPLCV